MPLSMVTLVGQWVDPDGSRSAGQILVEPTGEAVGGHSIVPATPLRIPLVSGVVAQSMVSTAQVPGLQYVVTEQIDGQDTVTYVITPTPSRHDTATATAGISTVLDAAIQSMDAGKLVVGAGIPIPSYVGTVSAGASFTLVDSSGAPALTTAAVTAVEVGAIDLSTADRSASPATSPLYVLASTLAQPSGVATLGSDGVLIPAQRPPAGSGTVTSVAAADGTIVIAGTPTVAPTVRVGAVAESQVTGLSADLAARLLAANNLSDVASTATARANLAVAAKPRFVSAYITSGDTALPNTGGLWAPLPGFEIDIPAAAHDLVELSCRGMRSITNGACVDFAVVTGATPTIVRYLSSGTSAPSIEGDPAWYFAAGFAAQSGSRKFDVALSDIDTGNLRIAIVTLTAGAGTLYSSTNYPFWWSLTNAGQHT